MAGASNRQLKKAGMSAKAVEHVRSTQGVVSSIASATKAAKRAGLPVKAAAGEKLARPAPKVTWAEKAKASAQKRASEFDVGALMKRDRGAAPAAPKVTWGEKAKAAQKKGADEIAVESLMKRNANPGKVAKAARAIESALRTSIASPAVTRGKKAAAAKAKQAAPAASPRATNRRPSGKQIMQLAYERRTNTADRPGSMHAKLGIRPGAA